MAATATDSSALPEGSLVGELPLQMAYSASQQARQAFAAGHGGQFATSAAWCSRRRLLLTFVACMRADEPTYAL